MENDPLILRIRQARKNMLLMHLPATVAEYPLEVCCALWGLFAGFTAGVPMLEAPSHTFQVMPPWAEEVWGIAMFIASLTLLAGLRRNRLDHLILLSRGLMLFSIILVSFGVAILGTNGYPRLLSGLLLILVGAAGTLRASKHKVDYYSAVEEATIEHHIENGHNGGQREPEEG